MKHLNDWKLPLLLLFLILTNLAGILEEYAKVDPLACEDCRAILSGITFSPDHAWLYPPGDGPKPFRKEVSASASKNLNWEVLEDPDPTIATREGTAPSGARSASFTFQTAPGLTYRGGEADRLTSFRIQGHTPEDGVLVGPATLGITLSSPKTAFWQFISPDPRRSRAYFFEGESGSVEIKVDNIAASSGWAFSVLESGKSHLFQSLTPSGAPYNEGMSWYGPQIGLIQRIDYVTASITPENCRSPAIPNNLLIPVGCYATVHVSAQAGNSVVSADLKTLVLFKKAS